MRAALFEPVTAEDRAVPYLTETAIFAQWFHSSNTALHYARWGDGEVDMVLLQGPQNEVASAVEVKWSDRYCGKPEELKSLIEFCIRNKLTSPLVTSKTLWASCEFEGVRMQFVPASVYCYTVGRNILKSMAMQPFVPSSTKTQN